MVLSVLLFRPRFPSGSYFWNNVLEWAGLVISLIGQSLRDATVGYDYIRRGGKGQQIWASRLVQGGMFAHCRNPLCLGNILIFLRVGDDFQRPARLYYWHPGHLFHLCLHHPGGGKLSPREIRRGIRCLCGPGESDVARLSGVLRICKGHELPLETGI